MGEELRGQSDLWAVGMGDGGYRENPGMERRRYGCAKDLLPLAIVICVYCVLAMCVCGVRLGEGRMKREGGGRGVVGCRAWLTSPCRPSFWHHPRRVSRNRFGKVHRGHRDYVEGEFPPAYSSPPS